MDRREPYSPIAGIRLEHARDGPVPEELRGIGVVVDALTVPSHFAEEQPLVEEVVDVVPLGPAAAGAGQFQGRGRPRVPIVLEHVQKLLGPRVLVVGGVAGQADPPVLVAVPAVVEDVGLRLDVGLDGLVHVLVALLPLLGGPAVVAEVVDDGTQGQIGPERGVALADRPIDVLHGPLDRRLSQRLDRSSIAQTRAIEIMAE